MVLLGLEGEYERDRIYVEKTRFELAEVRYPSSLLMSAFLTSRRSTPLFRTLKLL